MKKSRAESCFGSWSSLAEDARWAPVALLVLSLAFSHLHTAQSRLIGTVAQRLSVTSIVNDPNVDAMYAASGNAAPPQCAHIIYESTKLGLSKEKYLVRCNTFSRLSRSSVAGLRRQCEGGPVGYDHILQTVNGAGVHSMENVMTLRPDVRNYLD